MKLNLHSVLPHQAKLLQLFCKLKMSIIYGNTNSILSSSQTTLYFSACYVQETTVKISPSNSWKPSWQVSSILHSTEQYCCTAVHSLCQEDKCNTLNYKLCTLIKFISKNWESVALSFVTKVISNWSLTKKVIKEFDDCLKEQSVVGILEWSNPNNTVVGSSISAVTLKTFSVSSL